jgi:hypothetical protein
MLCTILGLHSGDYEEYRLLRYKTQICTPQETHYISAREASRLMLCKICGFHGDDYEECRLLGYKTQFVLHRKHTTTFAIKEPRLSIQTHLFLQLPNIHLRTNSVALSPKANY